jgi:hypothetical protein
MPVSKHRKSGKKHVRRQVDPLMCLLALQRYSVRQQPVDDEFAAPLEIAAYTALDTITRGHGGKSQWDILARCLNQSWLLAKGGLGAEAKQTLDESHQVMRRMIPGFEATGKVAFVSAGDQQIVEDALTLWSQQLRMAKIGEIDAATRIVEREYWKHAERRDA